MFVWHFPGDNDFSKESPRTGVPKCTTYGVECNRLGGILSSFNDNACQLSLVFSALSQSLLFSLSSLSLSILST